MNFFFEKIPSIFDIENWLWKYNFGTFWRTIIHRRIVLKQFPLSMLILGQKAWILGPTIFKIPQPNWHECRQYKAYPHSTEEWNPYLTWILMMTNHEFAIPTNRTRHNKMLGRYVNVGFNCIKSVALDQIYHGDRSWPELLRLNAVKHSIFFFKGQCALGWALFAKFWKSWKASPFP